MKDIEKNISFNAEFGIALEESASSLTQGNPGSGMEAYTHRWY